MMKKILIAAALAGSLGSFALPATSAIVVVRQAPPEPRSEQMPQHRRGYVWAPGYWDWKRNRHVWVRGAWVRERKGYVYNAPTWEERDGRWYKQSASWVRGSRDNDGDGVRNRNDRDRDGDGVRNRDDRRPDNPVRN